MKIKTIFKDRTQRILIFFSVPLWIIIFLLIHDINLTKMNQSADVNMTKLYFRWDNMQFEESKYTEFAVKIMNHYSRNMNRELRVNYIRQNWKISQALSFNPFEGPGIHYLETSLDPKGEHDYGEVGIGGIKYGTALWALAIQDRAMPEHLRKYVKVKDFKKEDLSDPIVSLKLTYTLIWYYRKVYNGMENWYISAYHWGGILDRHYKRGKNRIPTHFTLNGIKYNVIKYYVAWKEIVTAFNQGKLEPSAEIRARYRKYENKLVQEEINYRKCLGIIRDLQKKIKKREEVDKELQEALKKSERQMMQISGQSKKGFGRKVLLKVKDVARNLMKIFEKDIGGK